MVGGGRLNLAYAPGILERKQWDVPLSATDSVARMAPGHRFTHMDVPEQ